MIDKPSTEQGAADIVSRVRAAKEARKATAASEEASPVAPPETPPVPPVAAETDPAIPPTPDQQPYAYRQGDEFAATSRDWKEKGDFTKISDKEKWMKISEEDLDLDTQLSEMKKELDEFGKNYSKVAGEAGAKQGTIKKILNPLFNPEDYDEVKQALGEWQQKRDEFERAFYHDLALKLSRGEINDQFEKQQEHNFDALMAKEAIELHSRKYDFKKDYSAGKNWISPKIADGYNNFIGKFRKMHPALRIGAGAGIFVVGNIPATIAWRIIGGLAAGKGAHEGLQAAAELWRQRKERKSLQEFEKDMNRRNLSAQERINERLGRLERQNQRMEQRMAKYARGDYYRKFAGVVLAGLIGSGTMARLIQGTGIGSVIKEKIFGGGVVATQAVEHFRPSGGMPQDLSPEEYARIKKTMASYGPGRNMDEIVAGEADKMHAGGIMPEPEVKTGGSAQAWAETTHAGGAKVQMPEIAKPKFEDIASVKIKAGGSMWGSIENNIKANPAAYGLDPNDPSFTKDMHRMTQQMLDEFASRKGLSYEQLDQMARGGKVQPGSTFNIIHDPSTDEIYLDDKGKIFGADVSPGGASAAHEIAPSKASMPIDDMKPKTASIAPEDATRPRAGAAAEQQTTRARGGGKMKFSPEIEEMDRKAQASTAKALESQQHADSLKAQSVHEVAEAAKNNTKLYLSTRGLVNDIVNGAGVGNRANFWEHSMDNWKNLLNSEYQISQEVRLNDATGKTNISLSKLRSLYPILEKYHRQGIESIGDCLKEAVKNTKDLYEINKLVLRK